MKKKLLTALLCLALCLSLSVSATAISNETIDSSTISLSVTELEPGYYLCAVWRGDTLLRLFDYTVSTDGRMEATVEVGEKLETGTQLMVGISNANADGENAKPISPIVCYVKNVSSDFPINPGGNTSSGGGGSSSSGGSRNGYSINIPTRVTGGKIQVHPTNASRGSKVTITITPNAGYELDTLTVKDGKGNSIDLTDEGGGKYTFIMPASRVTVDATFKPIDTNSSHFTDVPSGSYYYDAVAWAVELEITAGTTATTFSPNAYCTRAQTVTFLWRAAGSPVPQDGVNPFTDVRPGSYYYNAVLWAVEQGITAGTSATTFSPDATVTRGQTVTFLYRAAGSPVASGGISFGDVADGAYYASAVHWAVNKGVTAGTSTTTFSPNDNCTRAQIVTFLYRDRAN